MVQYLIARLGLDEADAYERVTRTDAEGNPMKLPPEALVAAKVKAKAHIPKFRLPRKSSPTNSFFFMTRLDIKASRKTTSK